MPRTLYSPRLSDDVIRSLYKEGQRRRMPMTKLADQLLRQRLEGFPGDLPASSRVQEEAPGETKRGAR